MLDQTYLRTARQENKPLTNSDLLYFCSEMMAKPTLPMADVSNGEFLLKKNMFLGQSIFAYWKAQFTLILENVGSMNQFTGQEQAFLRHLVREIEWRASHKTLADHEATSQRELVKAMLDGIDWFTGDDTSSFDYILDTRKWVSKLMMTSLTAITSELYVLSPATLTKLVAYEKEVAALMARRVEAVDLGLTVGARAYKKAQGLIKHYVLVLADMKEGIIEQDGRSVSRAHFQAIDEQWACLREVAPKAPKMRARA